MADNAPSALQELTNSVRALIAANKAAEDAALERAKLDKEAAEKTTEKNKAEANYTKTSKDLKVAGEKVVSEFYKVAEAGIKLASTLGTQATKGIETEYKNRLSVLKSLLTQDVNSIASKKQIESAEQSLSEAFVNVREGFQISAAGAGEFASSLSKGFKTEFQPTAESIRALAQMGITTTAQMDAFRRATGRASLTSGQLTNLYSKNTLSFLLYGNSFAKAAANAEKLGINLANVQAAQEGLVTNLDGTIDTVAQLNQLGAQLDFGTLIRVAEQEGPDALMAYVRKSIPEQLMQSASTRALFKQLGISVEDYIKSGEKATSGADQIEKRMTEAAEKTGVLSNVTGFLIKAYQAGKDSFGGLILAVGGAILALKAFSAAASVMGFSRAAGVAGTASKVLTGISGLSTAIMGAQLGRSMVEQGYRKSGILTAGALGALGLGILAAPFTGGMSLVAASALIGTAATAGGIGAGIYAGMGKPANDMYSAGYGSRMLVTPSGAFALNNADDIIAGTNLFPKGTLQAGGNNSDLIRKVDNLITALSNANTTINVGGATQTVPRLQLVGVYSRNEVR